MTSALVSSDATYVLPMCSWQERPPRVTAGVIAKGSGGGKREGRGGSGEREGKGGEVVFRFAPRGVTNEYHPIWALERALSNRP